MGIRSDTKAALARLQGLYAKSAVFLLNTGLLFLFVNGVLGAAYVVHDRQVGPQRRLGRIVARHGIEKVARAYPGWQRADLLVLLDESARAFGNEYEPYTEFRPSAMRGRYVNFSENGYRPVRNQGPWPPERSSFNVFVFGGSTTFGLGVPDAQTIPSLLGDRLTRDGCGRPLHVYNFGRPAYIALQEAVLFERLLASEIVPDAAVFVDGLNEFYIWPRPLTADLMHEALARSLQPEAGPDLEGWFAALPLGRLARGLLARLRPPTPPDAEDLARERPTAEQAIAAWTRNARHIEGVARIYGVRTLFVWQPVPCYKYDLSQHLFFDAWSAAFLTPARMRRGYEILDAQRERGDPVDGFLWLADMQEGRRENLYLSDMHYRPVLAEEIAARIALHFEEKALLTCATARN